MTDAVEVVGFSPSTSLQFISDVLELPVRRQVRARLEVNEDVVRGLKFLSRDLYDETRFDERDWNAEKAFNLGVLHNTTTEQLETVIHRGFIPILQRIIVSPEEIPTNSSWLIRAAAYAAMKADHTLRIPISDPVAVRETEADTIGARIILHGCDTAGEKLQQWQIDEIIHPGATIKIELPPLPFQDRIDWQELPQSEISAVELDVLRGSQHYRLAQWLMFSLDGSVGLESDIRRKLDITLIRLTGEAPRTSHYSEFDVQARDVIHDIVPWRIGEWQIRLAKSLQETITGTVQDVRQYEIECDSDNVVVWVETLNAMLIQLARGATLGKIFEAGKRCADWYGRCEAHAMDPKPPYMQDIRDNHWHICGGCPKPCLCSFFTQVTIDPPGLMVCESCDDEDMKVGW